MAADLASLELVEQCLAARRGAAFFDESFRGRLWIAGRDRAKFLQGMVTQDVKALAPGEGALACALTIKGKIVSDMRVFSLADAFFLDLPEGRAGPLATHFRKFVIMAQVAIEDVSDRFAALAIEGPRARAALEAALGTQLPDLAPLGIAALPEGLFLARVSISGAPGFRLFAPREAAPALAAALIAAGALRISAMAADWLRIEGGTPAYGKDLDENTLPQEAGLEAAAISYTKGCYLGQETIARLHFLGHVNRTLSGLVFEGPEPAPVAGTPLFAEGGKEVGRVTSPGFSAVLSRPVALGYLRREANAPGTVVASGDPAGRKATVRGLPLAGGATT
jgi:folate-binding protein YgfZ